MDFTDDSSIMLKNKSSAAAEMGDRLATINMGRKVWDCCAPYGSGAEPCPHLTQCGLWRGLPSRHTKWRLDPSIRPFGHNVPTLQTNRQCRQLSESIGRTVLQTVVQ